MATVTKSIGTSSRNYSTITAWEADLDDTGIYSSGDVAVGECYDDSPFNEAVTIDGGGTVGLSSILLTAASGEQHDGTEGTGARIVASTARNVSIVSINADITWLEIDENSYDGRVTVTQGPCSVRNCLIHSSSNAKPLAGLYGGGGDVVFSNLMLYNIETTGGVNCSLYAVNVSQGTRPRKVYNVTAHDIANLCTGAVIATYGVYIYDHSGNVIKNVVATDVTATLETPVCFEPATLSSATIDHCASSDATASGTDSLTNITAANQYISTSPVDLRLKAGADCINAGTDLGTTPTGVNIDIEGRDRDSEGDIWDIGASEYVFYYIKKYYRIGKKVLRA